MTYEEFTEISGQEIRYEDYEKIVEPMYMATDMDKESFCKFITPSVKPLAKKYKEEKEKKNQKPVFISDGSTTPNGCYYVGQWMMLLKMEVSIATGKVTYTVRELTDEEQRATGWDSYLAYDININTMDERVKVVVK